MKDWSKESAYDFDCTMGCAKVVLDPKLHFFDDCFTGSIRMQDIDGGVERNGRILLLEWKMPGTQLKTGQKRFHDAFTRNSPNQTTIVVWGDPCSMRVDKVGVIHGGDWFGLPEESNGESLKRRIEAWFRRANMLKGAA